MQGEPRTPGSREEMHVKGAREHTQTLRTTTLASHTRWSRTHLMPMELTMSLAKEMVFMCMLLQHTLLPERTPSQGPGLYRWEVR